MMKDINFFKAAYYSYFKMAKRCKRNEDLSERFAIDTKLLKDDKGYYVHVCMHPNMHRHVITDLVYVDRRCLRSKKGKPCPHYRVFRDERSFLAGVSLRSVEVKVEYS
jgi:hypothetical protein